jgi:flagellar biosynthetic protein FliP
MSSRAAGRRAFVTIALALAALWIGSHARADGERTPQEGATPHVNLPMTESGADGVRQQLLRTAPTIAIFALASIVPAAVLMVTAFVRISIVLTLLRQALGSPQVPGNQVLSALALLLTAFVMQPIGEQVYRRGIEPYAAGRLGAREAWEVGTAPIKSFMIDQICRTHHEHYVWKLYDYVDPSPGRAEPTEYEQFPLRVIAPAFLLSELTTALVIAFGIYLPFLVIDLVVSAVLAAMGLFMLPPSLVAVPLKLILFVLADGWMLVSTMLLASFG